ncbi:MAG: DUF2946 domain-containing protein [Azoarcus sp.]|nr:DUF2946 domain-containing protein [Azoarcus sp.]
MVKFAAMRTRPLSISLSLSGFFRRHQRRIAWAALLAVCLQLLAANIGMLQAARPLPQAVDWGVFGAGDICHGNADFAEDEETGTPPAPSAGSTHCPFCRLAELSFALVPLTALSFPPPEPAAFFVPSDGSHLRLDEPDFHHVLGRAPPFSLPE